MSEMLDSAVLLGAADLIGQLGGDAADLAKRSRIPPAALFEAGIPVLGYSMTDFFELAAAECNCRYFGMLMAERSSPAVMGPLWKFLRTASTVGEMIEDLAANFDLYSEAAIVSLIPSDDGALLTFESRAGHCESEVQMVEFSLAVNCNEIRLHCPPGWNPASVLFRHAAPRDLGPHRRLFGPNLMFEQDRNAIFFDKATLGREMRTGRSRSRALAEFSLRELGLGRKPSIAARVEHTIRSQTDMADCSVDRICELLGVPSRTLQRQLDEEGHTFKSIKDTVRADLALKYVRQSSLSLGQIAEILGYSELSAFGRAFQRWYHLSPTRLRRQHLAQQSG